MEKKKPLYIPIKTLDSEDYVSGIGRLEVAILGLATGIAIMIGIIIAILVNSLVAICVGVLLIASVFLVVRRDSINENLIRKIKIIMQDNQGQKRYLYSYNTSFGGVANAGAYVWEES